MKPDKINDGLRIRSFSLQSRHLLSYRKLSLLVNRYTQSGHKRPFTIRFVSSHGELIEWKEVVCTSRNARARTHTYISTVSHNYRTIKDVLVLMVDDYKVTFE